MGTFESFRKAYGALKDSTMVGLAKVNSDFKDLDIAIVKATNHDECPPKERHVRRIFSATSVVRPRADVAYCIHALARRLAKTKNWIVALKTLIVIHRTLREGDPTFREELLNYSSRGQVLQISNFKDDSSPLAWDCSAWVRTYALFLEERLDCFRVLRYDIESERLTKSSQRATKAYSRTRHLASEDLLEQLPALQQLLYRLIGCLPEGAAFGNYLIQYALALVLKESFKIYCAINDGIINLVDMFFDMPRHDAVKALNIYKRAGKQAENLADFYEFCKGLDLAKHFQFPTLRQPPPSFLATMEEYVKEAPQTGTKSKKYLDHQEPKHQKPEPQQPPELPPPETVKQVEVEEKPVVETQEPETKIEVEAPPLIAMDSGDLLGLSETNPKVAELEKNNALALAIVPSGNDPASAVNSGWGDFGGAGAGANSSGWELSLVTAPSPNISHAPDNKLAGGFNKLLLDSLYEDEGARRKLKEQNAGYGYGTSMQNLANPFEINDPFSMSNSIAPSTNVQMALMAQQQQQQQQQQMIWQQQQQQQQQMILQRQQQQLQYQQPNYQQQQYKQQQDMMSMIPYQHLPQYPQQPMQMQNTGPSNPFGDPFFVQPQSSMPQQGNYGLL